MKVGITYDLKTDYLEAGFDREAAAEFDREETIAGIEAALVAAGYVTERVGNVQRLIALLVSGARWDMVFNIAEGVRGIAREAQVPALLDVYGIPYTFSDPMVLSLALHKGMAKRVVRDLGVPTPDFTVVEDEGDIAAVSLPFPLFAKPVAEGTGKGIGELSMVRSPQELESSCRFLLDRFQQPVLVEEYLPGREFTAGLVGTGKDSRVVGVMEVLLTADAERFCYSYRNKQEYERSVKYRPADTESEEKVADVALRAWRGLGCRDGGRIDLRMNAEGSPHFIEVNPLAGLDERISDLPILCRMRGISYHQLIAMIMESARKRVEGKRGARIANRGSEGP